MPEREIPRGEVAPVKMNGACPYLFERTSAAAISCISTTASRAASSARGGGGPEGRP